MSHPTCHKNLRGPVLTKLCWDGMVVKPPGTSSNREMVNNLLECAESDKLTTCSDCSGENYWTARWRKHRCVIIWCEEVGMQWPGVSLQHTATTRSNWTIYFPTLTCGYELWVVTKRRRLWIHVAKISFRHRVTGFSLKDGVRSSEGARSRATAEVI